MRKYICSHCQAETLVHLLTPSSKLHTVSQHKGSGPYCFACGSNKLVPAEEVVSYSEKRA